MPRSRDAERINYDVVNQPVRSIVTQRPAQVYRSQQIEQSPRISRARSYNDENEDVPFNNVSIEKPRRNSFPRKKRVRRVRYVRPPKSNFKIFEEKVHWNAQSKVNTHNEYLAMANRRILRPQIFREKTNWHAESKINSHNEEALHYLKPTPRPIIHDEKYRWGASTRIDNYNEEYIQHKQRERIIREQISKTPIQNFPQERRIKPDRPRIDNQNPEYIEHKKRKKSSKLPPIEDRKLEWEKRSRINQKNDDYIEHIRRNRSIPNIFREKLQWQTKTPRVDAHNREYHENLREPKTPIIFNKLPHWHARPKIDTGLEPYEDEDDYYEYPV